MKEKLLRVELKHSNPIVERFIAEARKKGLTAKALLLKMMEKYL